MWIRDGAAPDPPAITNNSPVPSVVNGEKYFPWSSSIPSLAVSGRDVGLGVWNVAVLKDDGTAMWGPYWFTKNAQVTTDGAQVCSGTRANPCPINAGTGLLPFKNIVEGDNSGRVVATDAQGAYTYGTRVHVRYSAYPTSAEYGGADLRINTSGELAALRSRMRQEAVASGDALWRQVRPEDMAWIASDEYGPDDLQQSCREVFQTDFDGYAWICREGEYQSNDDVDGEPVASMSAYGDVALSDKPELHDFCFDHGLLRKARCRGYLKDAEHAQEKARALYSGIWSKSDQTVSNAFQHAYWTGLMTNRGYPTYEWEGITVSRLWEGTKSYGFKFKSEIASLRRPSQMDMLNNTTGYNVTLDEIAAKGIRSRSELCVTFGRDGLPQQYPAKTDPFNWWGDRSYHFGFLAYRRSYDKVGNLVQRVNLDC